MTSGKAPLPINFNNAQSDTSMVVERLSRTWFSLVHGRNLVYNQCWEDPRLDRVALNLTSKDRVVVITSAGCNALDYALAGAGHVHAVDMNPRQNALLELKKACAKVLNYDDFFAVFGKGNHPRWTEIYRDSVRKELPAEHQKFWDVYTDFFTGRGSRKSFYFRGTSGTFAWVINVYIDRMAKVRDGVNAILAAKNVEQQQDLFQQYRLGEQLWRPFLRWAMRRDMTLALLGVPRAQRRQLDEQYPGGIYQFIVDRVETVFTKLPIHDNYAWRVYLTGDYTPTCCPEYLKPENFEKLKTDVIHRVTTHTDSVTGFLRQSPHQISRFVLLDHMDWLTRDPKRVALTEEWQAIVDRATDDARILWRSAAMKVDFVDPLQISVNGQTRKLGDLLTYHRDLAEELHAKDRVHTYASFSIADLKKS